MTISSYTERPSRQIDEVRFNADFDESTHHLWENQISGLGLSHDVMHYVGLQNVDHHVEPG